MVDQFNNACKRITPLRDGRRQVIYVDNEQPRTRDSTAKGYLMQNFIELFTKKEATLRRLRTLRAQQEVNWYSPHQRPWTGPGCCHGHDNILFSINLR